MSRPLRIAYPGAWYHVMNRGRRGAFHDLHLKRKVPEARILSYDPDEIKEVVCAFYRVSRESLEKSRRGISNRARDVAIYLVRRHCQETLTRVGSWFNLPNYSSVSSAVIRVKDQLQRDVELRQQVESIEKMLEKGQRQT